MRRASENSPNEGRLTQKNREHPKEQSKIRKVEFPGSESPHSEANETGDEAKKDDKRYYVHFTLLYG